MTDGREGGQPLVDRGLQPPRAAAVDHVDRGVPGEDGVVDERVVKVKKSPSWWCTGAGLLDSRIC